MKMFEFDHNIPRQVEFVNGSYCLTDLKTLEMSGKTILYCLGEACLDNSCCGTADCTYAIVIGEVLETNFPAGRPSPVSRMKRITNAEEQQIIRLAIQNTEQLQTVNFHLPENEISGHIPITTC